MNGAASPDKMDELLERWDDLRRQGKEVSAEELCSGCADQVEELRRRIEALKATNWLEKPSEDGDSPNTPK